MKLRKAPFPIKNMEDTHVFFVIEYLKTRKAAVAAEALGLAPEYGYKLLQREDVKTAINCAMAYYYKEAHIDAEWLLNELVDNHFLARQQGNISASNQALNTIAKHRSIDAFAADKLELADDSMIAQRLLRGRKRMNQIVEDPDTPSFL